MQNKSNVYVSLEFTPNPNTLKYSANIDILPKGAVSFTTPEQAKRKSNLASQLFEIAGITGVMIGKTFVTVSKAEDGDWDLVHRGASKLIQTFLESGAEVVVQSETLDAHKGGDSEIEKKIREVLDNEIRPSVAMDGGDITFDRFDNGVVYLFLQGSCAGCPSSTMTLKMGIETRLKQAIPEVTEVVSTA